MNIDWEKDDSILLLNPCYSQEEKLKFMRLLEEAKESWPGHLWLSTSGSSSQKWVGLSKKAVLCSAASVNEHLKSHPSDRWVHALPDFHVGGLGIWARAYLSGAAVADFKKDISHKWNAESFYQYAIEVQGTLSSLVPTQLYDLIKLGYRAPDRLRAIIVGGGSLPILLYEQAINLGWPILPSYGLTECASQVATAPLATLEKKIFPSLQLLPHLQSHLQEEHLCFSGPSLLSTYAFFSGENIHFYDPKKNGWFISDDLGTLQNDSISISGRKDAMYKIGGENVDLSRLDMHLQNLRLQLKMTTEASLLAMPDERLGNSIHLASNAGNFEEISSLIDLFQKSVLPFERIRKIHLLERLPRSPLGKIIKNELIETISSTVHAICDCAMIEKGAKNGKE